MGGVPEEGEGPDGRPDQGLVRQAVRHERQDHPTSDLIEFTFFQFIFS